MSTERPNFIIDSTDRKEDPEILHDPKTGEKLTTKTKPVKDLGPSPRGTRLEEGSGRKIRTRGLRGQA